MGAKGTHAEGWHWVGDIVKGGRGVLHATPSQRVTPSDRCFGSKDWRSNSRSSKSIGTNEVEGQTDRDGRKRKGKGRQEMEGKSSEELTLM